MRLIPRTVRAVVAFVTILLLAALANAQQHGHVAQTASSPALGQRTPAPQDAYVYIGWPNDGQTLSAGRVKIWFGARNIGGAPAGVTFPETRHPPPHLNRPH